MKKVITLILGITSTLSIYSQVWTQLNSGTTHYLLGVSAVTPDLCYISGEAGLILKTIDGGANWNTQTSNTVHDIYSIRFVNPDTGIAVGDNGTILRTINGGTNWTSINQVSQPLRFVYFYNDSVGFISGAGGLMLKTTNSGASWSTLSTGISQQINSIFFVSPTEGYASAFGGKIIKTINGGTSWTQLTSGVSTPLGILQFSNATDAIAIGDGGLILQTQNSGASWTPVSSGTTDVLTGFDFIDSLRGYIVGGNIGANTATILKTSDGGNSWYIYYPPSVSRLARIDFAKASNVGYAIGDDGFILKTVETTGCTIYNTVSISVTDTLVINASITSLNNFPFQNTIKVYPNPTSDQLIIDYGNYNSMNGYTLKITNSLGQTVYTTVVNQQQSSINLSTWTGSGIYFVNIIDPQSNTVEVKKIIVQ
jgi:photosystem II stability/assembly factor-like uncharacterized protein